MLASGSADRWPFDRYTTKTISAEVFVGTGESRRFVPARIEVSGSLYGWDVRADRSTSSGEAVVPDDDATIYFCAHADRQALIIGICLVLITLPALALFVAIEMLTGKRKFQPPFGTWFAAMLFAVVPLRSVLPGSPPPGSWIDEAVVLWVLIALAVAMTCTSWAGIADANKTTRGRPAWSVSHGVGLTQDVETEVVLGNRLWAFVVGVADESTRSMIGDAISKRMDSSAENYWAHCGAASPMPNVSAGPTGWPTLHVVVERELVRVRADLHRHDFVLTLVRDPGLDQIGGENAALGEVFVILLEVVDHSRELRRGLRNVGGLVRRQLIQVLVDQGPAARSSS